MSLSGPDAIAAGTVVEPPGGTHNRIQTPGLLEAIEDHGFTVVLGGARRDEDKVRAKERVFSFRDEFGQWSCRRSTTRTSATCPSVTAWCSRCIRNCPPHGAPTAIETVRDRTGKKNPTPLTARSCQWVVGRDRGRLDGVVVEEVGDACPARYRLRRRRSAEVHRVSR
ncbi:phosphoadenosine phosphosulfate reductase family protein [Pseudonocardia endophytica]|uniref:phosphoadenosine phosphosulfate reductase domain-containing protein n=1 Tax=Pseudonocardia endophytica TaxID=401976 RepID=UPI003C73DE73